MDLKEIDSHYAALISAYLSGNASPAQTAELEAWVLADAENKRQFMAFKKAWMLAGISQEEEKVPVEQLWQQTSRQLFENGKVVDLKKRPSFGSWALRIAAVGILLLLGYFIFKPKNEARQFYASTEAQHIQLADGSKVILNRQSRLEYLESKEGKRRVKLEGDAYFEVARDEGRPFVIRSSQIEVEVLGTSFYVDAREELEEIQVMVQSGKVAVRTSKEEKVLQADEKAIFQKSKQELLKEENEDPNFLSLKTDSLSFDNMTLEEVVFALERHFGVDISLENEELITCPILGVFVNKSLDAILNVIQATHNIQVNRLPSGDIRISGSCEG